MGPIEQLGHLLREPQLVVPLAGLADEAGLVAHLLAPADGHGPGTEPAPLDGRGAPDISRSGTWSVAALIAPITPLASPTLVWRITAWGRPLAK